MYRVVSCKVDVDVMVNCKEDGRITKLNHVKAGLSNNEQKLVMDLVEFSQNGKDENLVSKMQCLSKLLDMKVNIFEREMFPGLVQGLGNDVDGFVLLGRTTLVENTKTSVINVQENNAYNILKNQEDKEDNEEIRGLVTLANGVADSVVEWVFKYTTRRQDLKTNFAREGIKYEVGDCDSYIAAKNANYWGSKSSTHVSAKVCGALTSECKLVKFAID
ncbi:hypothetical protein Tco_0755009 [Tanacetum coccineum]